MTFTFAPRFIINIGIRYVLDGSYYYCMRNNIITSNYSAMVGSFLDCSYANSSSYTGLAWGPATHSTNGTLGPNLVYTKKSTDGKTIYMYNSSGAQYCYNGNKYIYYFLGASD